MSHALFPFLGRFGYRQYFINSAYVTGVALAVMSGLGKQLTPQELKNHLTDLALRGVIKGIPPNTPNLLLNTGFRPQ